MEETTDRVAFGGVDTHRDTHLLALLDWKGEVVLTREFASDVEGCALLADVVKGFGGAVLVGVEAVSTYGAGVARALSAAGIEVREVLGPNMRPHGSSGKSDPLDAVAAARSVMSGESSYEPKEGHGAAGCLRFLEAARRQSVKAATSVCNTVKSLVVAAPDPVRSVYGAMPTDRLMASLSGCEPSGGGLQECALEALRTLARQWTGLVRTAAELEERMSAVLLESHPALMATEGVGTVVAAALVVGAGDNPKRFPNEAAFAKACGACPIPASSGKTVRHRLNRGGNRRMNWALHTIARSRMKHDARTKAYVDKRTSQGKSMREIRRCLVRFIAREVYGALISPGMQPHPGRECAAKRTGLGLTQKRVGELLGCASWKVSRYETRRFREVRFEKEYLSLLKNQHENEDGAY